MKYTVEGGTAEFGGDVVLDLTSDQAAVRQHALEKVEGGWRPKSVVQFKAGETLGVDRTPDKLSGKLGEVLRPGTSKSTVASIRAKRPRTKTSGAASKRKPAD